MASESPPASDYPERERERSAFDGVLPELIKRVIEAGVERLSPEHVRQVAREMKLPKEALAYALSQMEESKHGLYRAVARELRDFLDHTNFAEELAKALTMLTFEVTMQIRFVPNEASPGAKPDVSTKVRMKRNSEAPASGPPSAGGPSTATSKTAAPNTVPPKDAQQAAKASDPDPEG